MKIDSRWSQYESRASSPAHYYPFAWMDNNSHYSQWQTRQAYQDGWKINLEIISAVHTNFLVKVELMCVQDPGSSSKSLWRLITDTLDIWYWTKITQNQIITYINFPRKHLLWPTQISTRKQHGLKINIAHINSQYENQHWL